MNAQAERVVEDMLARHGWTRTSRAPLTTSGVYSAQTFGKAGCGRELIVVSLGSTREAVAMIESHFGGDVAYLVGARLSSTVSLLEYKARALVAGMSFMRRRVMPILAISPPPPHAPAACLPPPASAWEELSAAP